MNSTVTSPDNLIKGLEYDVLERGENVWQWGMKYIGYDKNAGWCVFVCTNYFQDYFLYVEEKCIATDVRKSSL